MMEQLGKFTAGLTMFTITMFLRAFVGLKFYGWFIFGVFDVPELTILQVIGINFCIALYLKSKSKNDEDVSIQNIWKKFYKSVLMYSAILLMGFLLYLLY